MVTWSDIEIVIPTIQPDRNESLHKLLDQLIEQCHGASIRIEVQQAGQPPNARVDRCFGKQKLRKPKRDAWILYIEDDVFLAPSFGKIVPAVLDCAEHVHFVSFYSGRDEIAPGLMSASRELYGALCIAITSARAAYLPWAYWNWINKNPAHHDAVDLAIGELMQPGLIYYPSQVQHRKLKSTLGKRSRYRQSPSFRKAYGAIDE